MGMHPCRTPGLVPVERSRWPEGVSVQWHFLVGRRFHGAVAGPARLLPASQTCYSEFLGSCGSGRSRFLQSARPRDNWCLLHRKTASLNSYFSILLYSVFRSMLSICAALLLLYLAFCSTSMISFRSCASLCSRRSGFSADVSAAVTSPDRLIA